LFVKDPEVEIGFVDPPQLQRQKKNKKKTVITRTGETV
jgi:hypothetical protein